MGAPRKEEKPFPRKEGGKMQRIAQPTGRVKRPRKESGGGRRIKEGELNMSWEHRGRRKSPSQKKEGGKTKIDPEWAPEMKQKHRKSLPNGRQQNPRGRREAPPPWGAPKAPLVVCHLVRISYDLLHFPGPFWADFPSLFRIWSGSRSRPIQDFK